MVPSRNGPKGAELASFGLAILVFLLTPTQVGYQDLAALMAQQPAVAARWRDHRHRLAVRHDPRRDLQPAASDRHRDSRAADGAARKPQRGDVTGSIGDRSRALLRRAGRFPDINRAGKGDRLVPGLPSQPEPVEQRDDATSRGRECLPSIYPVGRDRRDRPHRHRTSRRAGRSCSPRSRARRTGAMPRPASPTRSRPRCTSRRSPNTTFRSRSSSIRRSCSTSRPISPTSIRPNSPRMRRRVSKASTPR